jgi:hypothetical protein
MELLFRRFMSIFGLRMIRIKNIPVINYPIEFTQDEILICQRIWDKKLTMTSMDSLIGTILACKYIIKEEIEGAFVECGVWRGGHAIAAAAIFKLHGKQVQIYLYDTFAGMTEPTKNDVYFHNDKLAIHKYELLKKENFTDWCFSSLEEVKSNFNEFAISENSLNFIKGDVLDSLAEEKNLPGKIAYLRLDTDWYESTKMELKILFPRLSNRGILVIDDYTAWSGSKKATDEYFDANSGLFLLPFDNGGRIGIKATIR